jgi:hypothetical protein
VQKEICSSAKNEELNLLEVAGSVSLSVCLSVVVEGNPMQPNRSDGNIQKNNVDVFSNLSAAP